MNLGSLLTQAPKGINLLQMAQRAANGDPEAVTYLRENGLYDVLDLVVHPGAGTAGRKVLEGVREMASGEYTQVLEPGESYPWSGFVKRLLNQRSGGHIFLGQMGTGKTTLAVKLAWQWANKLGYDVEFVGLYGEDLPDFGKTVHFDTLVHRMGCLTEYLKAQGVPDDEDYFQESGDDDEDEELELFGHRTRIRKPRRPRYKAQLPPARKVIVIDEMGMQVKRGVQSAQREAVMQYLAQSRHVHSLVLFLAQYASQIPLNVFGQSTIWVKRPTGSEKDTDRDNILVRQCWEEAEEAFRRLRQTGWQVDPYQDWRSWAYVHCPSLTGAPGYQGMVPFTKYDPRAALELPIEGEFREVE